MNCVWWVQAYEYALTCVGACWLANDYVRVQSTACVYGKRYDLLGGDPLHVHSIQLLME